jgi:hypothetical protein
MAAPGAMQEHQPLQGAARIWGTIALSGATFMNVLDTSIANVSLPAIAGDLGVSPNQGTWVITSFAVANAISVPLIFRLVPNLYRKFFVVPKLCRKSSFRDKPVPQIFQNSHFCKFFARVWRPIRIIYG